MVLVVARGAVSRYGRPAVAMAAAEVWTMVDGAAAMVMAPRSFVVWCSGALTPRTCVTSGYLRVEHLRVELLSACLSPFVAATAVRIVLRRTEVDSTSTDTSLPPKLIAVDKPPTNDDDDGDGSSSSSSSSSNTTLQDRNSSIICSGLQQIYSPPLPLKIYLLVI